VIIGYHEYDDTAVEDDILNAVGARTLRIPNLASSDRTDVFGAADALMVSVQPVGADLLAQMPRCRIVSRVGTGIDAIDLDAATKRRIWVTNVPDYAVDEVSTHAIALLLAHARRLPPLIEATRKGVWDYRTVAPIQRLSGQTLGVLGFGRIARKVAVKAQALGLRVLAYDRFVSAGEVEAAGVCPVDLPELLRESDFVSLHTPLTDTTRAIINAEALALMKPTAFLINTARGALVDEDALIDALRRERIAGVALDVLASEPPAPDHPLLHLDRAWITPHTAWYSEAASRDMRARAAEEVVRVLRGERPRARVNNLDEG
jgi:D-3-phosphoglycerate dehydrogenase